MYDAVDPDLYDQPADPEDPTSPTLGEIADGSLARQGEILEFLSEQLGPHPFSTGGRIVDDVPDLFFALETPDPLDLSGVSVHRPDRQRPPDGARERPPVVRGQRRSGRVEAHVAERRLRHLRRVALAAETAASTLAGGSTTTTGKPRTPPAAASLLERMSKGELRPHR
jgi:hypothetical protein